MLYHTTSAYFIVKMAHPVQQQAQPQYDYDMSDNDTSTYGEADPELIRLQIDVDRELKKFEYEVLRGMIEMKDTRTGEIKYVPIAPGQKPPLNELGVRELLARIKGRVTTIAKLSYKKEDEIYKDMFYFDMSLTELIAKRSDIWELDMEIAKSIKDASIELVWDTLCSSREGFTAINLRSQYSRQDVSRSDITDKGGQRSFLGIPLGRR